MKAKRYAARIVTSLDQVSEGYVPVPSLRGNANGYWPTVAKALSDAHAAGVIRAEKVVRSLGDLKTGRVFLHEEDARAFIAERYPHALHHEPQVAAAEPPKQAVARESDDELLAAIRSLIVAIHDLTAATQLLAERQIEPPKQEGHGDE